MTSSSPWTTNGNGAARIGPDNNETVRTSSDRRPAAAAAVAIVLAPETCDFPMNKFLLALNKEAKEALQERRHTRPCATGSTAADWCPHFLSSSWSVPDSRHQDDGEPTTATAVTHRDAESDEETASFVSGSEVGDGGAAAVSGIKKEDNLEEILEDCYGADVKVVGVENTLAGSEAQKHLNVSQVGGRPPAETLDLATRRPDYSIDAFLKALTVEKRVRGRCKTFPPSRRYSHGDVPPSARDRQLLIDRMLREYHGRYVDDDSARPCAAVESAGTSRRQTQCSPYFGRSPPCEMSATPRDDATCVTRSTETACQATAAESTVWTRAFRCCFGIGRNSDSQVVAFD